MYLYHRWLVLRGLESLKFKLFLLPLGKKKLIKTVGGVEAGHLGKKDFFTPSDCT